MENTIENTLYIALFSLIAIIFCGCSSDDSLRQIEPLKPGEQREVTLVLTASKGFVFDKVTLLEGGKKTVLKGAAGNHFKRDIRYSDSLQVEAVAKSNNQEEGTLSGYLLYQGKKIDAKTARGVLFLSIKLTDIQ